MSRISVPSQKDPRFLFKKRRQCKVESNNYYSTSFLLDKVDPTQAQCGFYAKMKSVHLDTNMLVLQFYPLHRVIGQISPT